MGASLFPLLLSALLLSCSGGDIDIQEKSINQDAYGRQGLADVVLKKEHHIVL